ncbi:unnamed protein product [Orchesella dallaii]|uniref:Peptidase S1 domain-containing protein n=1 Tax=Orchesella dallaii TaxID=48710 RepID=A0ABP1RUL9_9HEXA
MKVVLVILIIAFISIVEVNLIPYRNSHNIRWKNEVDFNQGYGPPPFFPDDHPTGRIVGGTDAKSGQVSYQLFLRGKTAKGERYHCGAALINEYNVQFALTAAHCVYDGYPHHKDTVEPRNVRLTAGEISLKTKSGREQYRTPHRIVMHESFEYDEDHPHDDIAIVFYRKPFTINYYVQPIALPDYLWAQPPRMTISGWGSTTPEPHLTDPDVLQVVDQRTLDNYICGKFYKTNYTTQIYNIVDYRQICLLEDYRKVGFCEGKFFLVKFNSIF